MFSLVYLCYHSVRGMYVAELCLSPGKDNRKGAGKTDKTPAEARQRIAGFNVVGSTQRPHLFALCFHYHIISAQTHQKWLLEPVHSPGVLTSRSPLRNLLSTPHYHRHIPASKKMFSLYHGNATTLAEYC